MLLLQQNFIVYVKLKLFFVLTDIKRKLLLCHDKKSFSHSYYLDFFDLTEFKVLSNETVNDFGF